MNPSRRDRKLLLEAAAHDHRRVAHECRRRPPAELAAKTAADPAFVDNVGFKVGAKVVPGSVRRDNASRTIDFKVSDGVKTYPVTYRGLVPDTFTDANDIEVVVEGRLGRDGVIRATDVLAKCGSRYEAVPKA